MRFRFQGAYAILVLLVLVLQLGCASNNSLTRRTPVPASNIYCLRESTDVGFRSSLKTSYAMYGSRKLGGLGNGSVCDLIAFDNYVVNWQTKDGRSERFEFDFEQIMRKFQDENPQLLNMQRLNGQPDLLIHYAKDRIEVSYIVLQYQPGGMEIRNGLEILTKPFITNRFLLLTVPISTPTD